MLFFFHRFELPILLLPGRRGNSHSNNPPPSAHPGSHQGIPDSTSNNQPSSDNSSAAEPDGSAPSSGPNLSDDFLISNTESGANQQSSNTDALITSTAEETASAFRKKNVCAVKNKDKQILFSNQRGNEVRQIVKTDLDTRFKLLKGVYRKALAYIIINLIPFLLILTAVIFRRNYFVKTCWCRLLEFAKFRSMIGFS